jgi:hypothetical protein
MALRHPGLLNGSGATTRKGALMLSPRRWRLPLLGILAAIAVLIGTAAPALAAASGMPGESSSYTEEQVGNNNGGTSDLFSAGSESEAWTSGDEVQVWRGSSNNSVWLAVNGSRPFTLGSTTTYVNPTVVPYGTNQVMIFQTGTDNGLYYTFYSPQQNVWSGAWFSVPAQSTTQAMSAAQIGSSTKVEVTYLSSNSDAIWGTLWNGSSWSQAVNIGGGTGKSAPAVTYNPYSGLLFVIDHGLDNSYYMIAGSPTGNNWGTWSDLYMDSSSTIQPEIATVPNSGLMLTSIVNSDGNPYYQSYNFWGQTKNSMSQDITGWQTVYPVTLLGRGSVIYALFTGFNEEVYWKVAFWAVIK